jgi:hypothetical protein
MKFGLPAAILALLVTLPSAGAAPALTKLQSRHLPQQRVTQIVMAQLADILIGPGQDTHPVPNRDEMRRLLAIMTAFDQRTDAATAPSDNEVRRALGQFAETMHLLADRNATPHPVNPLARLNFIGRPAATATPGLCLANVIAVDFDTVGRDRGASTPVRARDFAPSRYFAFVAPPASLTPGAAGLAERQQTNTACARLDVMKGDFFFAPDEQSALRGAWLSRALLDAVRRADPSVVLDCHQAETPNGWKGCPAFLEEVLKGGGGNVGDCPWSGSTCELDYERSIAKLVISTAPDDPSRITRVVASETIWFGHDRVD